MESLQSTTVKLRDVLVKGFISVGSTDLMDSIDIIHPHKYIVEQSGDRSVIKGRYFHGSRRDLIAKPTGIDFLYDPVSEDENDYQDNVDNCDHQNDTNVCDHQNNANICDHHNDDKTISTVVNAQMHQNDLKWLCGEEDV